MSIIAATIAECQYEPQLIECIDNTLPVTGANAIGVFLVGAAFVVVGKWFRTKTA